MFKKMSNEKKKISRDKGKKRIKENVENILIFLTFLFFVFMFYLRFKYVP